MFSKVSVVIPVFNRPAAVRRAINSVLAQTFQDFEIIVVDDASTDATAVAVTALSDPRIRLVRHDRNRGGSAARNTGIEASSAPYVAFLDSDDEWLPTKLESQLELFRRSGDRVGLAYCGIERMLADGTIVGQIPQRCEDLARRLLRENVIGGTSVGMVRRQVFDEIGGFDDALPATQDLDLWLRICEQFSADFVPEILVRIWQENDTRITASVPALIRGRLLFCEKHRQKLMQYRLLHLWFREVGWIHHRYAGDRRMAREAYVKSIKVRPTAPGAYALLLAAYMPNSWLNRLAWCKHLVIGWFSTYRSKWRPDPPLDDRQTVNVQRNRTTKSAAS
jgi:glycosyltransferase involved in cell wall biosynthesis